MALRCASPQGLAEIADLVVERLPVAREYVFARDDDIDFLGTIGNRSRDFVQFEFVGDQAGGESRRDRGDRNAAARECVDGGSRQSGDRRRPHPCETEPAQRGAAADAQGIEQVGPDRLTGFRAEPPYTPAVSSPLSVVRSMQEMALSSQAACASFLTERRVPSVATRRSTALIFTRKRIEPGCIERHARITGQRLIGRKPYRQDIRRWAVENRGVSHGVDALQVRRNVVYVTWML